MSGGISPSLPATAAPPKHSSGADKSVANKRAAGNSAGKKTFNSSLASEPHLFPFDSGSVAQLAVGSSVVIATLLALPDAIALIPGAPSLVSWTLRLIGVWVIGAVLWFVGFSALAQGLRIISRGVFAGPGGLKVSRFDRIIQWEDIQAISLEPNAFFTRIFQLKVPARKLTVYFRFTGKNKVLAHLLFPNFIPSFFFTKETFDSLVRAICDKTDIIPASSLPDDLENQYSLFAFRPEQIATVRGTLRWQNKQRTIVTLIIAVSLILFLGRKAAVNYAFNSGQKAYREGRLEKAIEFYELSTKLEPTFAAAWNALGQSEFHLAETNLTDFSRARRDWKIALLCKPDYVESRLNLTRLALYQRNFAEAGEQLERASLVDPQNLLGMLDRAELDVRRGRAAAGIKKLRLMLSEAERSKLSPARSEYVFLGHTLLAQAKLDTGDPAGAAEELKNFSEDPADYASGENVTYLYIVKSRLLTAQGKFAEAEKLAAAAVRRQPRNEEAIAQAALIEVELGKFQLAEQYLADARALLVPDPWLSIAYGRQMLAEKKLAEAFAAFSDALRVPDQSQDVVALQAVYDGLAHIDAQPGNRGGADQLEELRVEALTRAKKIFGLKTDSP